MNLMAGSRAARAGLAAVCLGLVPGAAAFAQTPCGGSGLLVRVDPAEPLVGEPITVTLDNPTAATYFLSTSCVYQAVRATDCAGSAVDTPICLFVVTPIPPGTSIAQVWPQTDFDGQQVAPGSYAFEIAFSGPAGPEACCPVVAIRAPCAAGPAYGAGDAGSGGFVPVLGGAGEPQVGSNTFRLEIAGGLGGAQGALLVGGAPANLATGFGTLLVDPTPPVLLHIVTLDGPPGVAGAGSKSLPAPVPADPLLAGQSFFGQAIFLDPVSSGGRSHTQGLEVTICP